MNMPKFDRKDIVTAHLLHSRERPMALDGYLSRAHMKCIVLCNKLGLIHPRCPCDLSLNGRKIYDRLVASHAS